MHKAIANPILFAIAYVVFVWPSYYLATGNSVGSNWSSSVLTWPFMLYLLSMLVLTGLCLVRGAMIGKHWLVLLPMVAFTFNLLPTLNNIPYVPYVYHLLAIFIGVACPMLNSHMPDSLSQEN